MAIVSSILDKFHSESTVFTVFDRIQKLKGGKGHVEYLLHIPEEGNDGGNHSTVSPQSTLIVRFLRQSHVLSTKDLKGYHIL